MPEFASSTADAANAAESEYTAFGSPQAVAIVGYDGDAMEPFVTRDGRYLLFNNRNDPPDKTRLYYAERIDDTHFRFAGEIRGANVEGKLTAVASLDCHGEFYFVSNRSYDTTYSTLYHARFAAGAVRDVAIVSGVAVGQPPFLNFDAEISPDGRTLYAVVSEFSPGGPKSATIAAFARRGNAFVTDDAEDTALASVNAGGAIVYAPDVSADGRELFYTKLTRDLGGPHVAIERVARDRPGAAFGAPLSIAAISGFAEAPSLSPDGRSLYYHQLVAGRFVIKRVVRSRAAAGSGSRCAQ
jgi:Tol biopolymer transport system component